MALNFPSSPSVNDIFTSGSSRWIWDGSSWVRQGKLGSQGATGAQGSAGVQGAAGAQGSAGVQGAAGAQGATGATGAQGSAGAQGTAGAQGATGTAGAQGAQGTAGSQGTGGTTGSRGGVPYTFSSTTTDSDPGLGVIRYNNIAIPSVTQIFFDNSDSNNNTQFSWYTT